MRQAQTRDFMKSEPIFHTTNVALMQRTFVALVMAIMLL